MDSTAASASSHAACATDIPRRRAAYALYLAVDLVFAAVTLARLVRTARLSRAQHRAARDAAAQPLLDRTSPAPEPASDPATTTTISFTPKILYFSLTFSTCIGLPMVSLSLSPSLFPHSLHIHACVCFYHDTTTNTPQCVRCCTRCRARRAR